MKCWRHLESRMVNSFRPAAFASATMCILTRCHSIDGAEHAGRLTLNFNPDWRFIKSDPAGAQQPGFDDAQWATVSAPHTYNDVDTFDDPSLTGHRGEQNQFGGRTWYRKSFKAP